MIKTTNDKYEQMINIEANTFDEFFSQNKL